MKLQKDDPVYYKAKIRDLMKEAREQGLEINVTSNTRGIEINFKANNGDSASVVLGV